MAAIPGVSLNITGASGSQNLLSPKQGWYAYVFPRGAWASADSTGTQITFDTAAIAGRFATNDWIQVGTATANLRQVSAVGGNSITVSGAAVTVTEDNRIFIIGNTQPTTSGGSATYLVPRTTILHRDDDASDRYTNSRVTTNSDGLAQFYCEQGLYDVLLQDGNQSNQGYVADLPVGVAEGVSTSLVAVFGATVTMNAALGVTGWATLGQTVTMNANAGVTGTFTVGATLTAHANAGVTGTLIVGATATFSGRLYGTTGTFSNGIGVTGTGVFGATITTTGITNVGDVSTTRDLYFRRVYATRGTTLTAAGFSLSAAWGSTATVSLSSRSTDTAGYFIVAPGGAGMAADPTVTINFVDGAFANGCIAMVTRIDGNTGIVGYWNGPVTVANGMTQAQLRFASGIPTGALIAAQYLIVGL